LKDFPQVGGEDGELLETALAAARRGADAHRDAAARLDPSSWTEKGPADFVTDVDREAERRILETLRERHPGHAVLAEESSAEESSDEAAVGGARASSGPGAGAAGGSGTAGAAPPVRWIVDPLDGTTNWLHAYPEHAVSIAAADADGLRVGVVLNSATGETFTGVRGRGAWRDGEPIRVSGVDRLHLALVGTGFPFTRQEVLPDYLEVLGRVIRATSGVRRAGAAALDLCDLACGRLDAFWEWWLMPWDVAAGALILREAGGRFAPLEPPAGPEREAPRVPEAPELASGGYRASNGALDAAFAELVEGG